MVKVYLKNFRKKWLNGVAPPIVVTMFAPLIASIWPEFKEQASAWTEILKNPVYQAFLGRLGLADIGTWSGFYFMYIFVWLEMILVYITIFVPVRLISTEVDKNTLDVMLSYPIPRWRYLFEKFSVYLSYNFLYPILILTTTYLSTVFLNEEMDYIILTYSLIGVWFWFFALGALSLLCGTIFLESNKALSAAGVLILGQYILVRIGDLVESLNILKRLSIFNYLNAGTIIGLGKLPLDELFIVAGVGILALLGALYVFQNRELAF